MYMYTLIQVLLVEQIDLKKKKRKKVCGWFGMFIHELCVRPWRAPPPNLSCSVGLAVLSFETYTFEDW